MQNPGSDAGVFVWGATKHSCGTKISPPSFRDAPLGAGPESILTIVVMDSGLDATHRPGMTSPYLTGLTGADNCSVRSRSVMSTTVTMGAVSS